MSDRSTTVAITAVVGVVALAVGWLVPQYPAVALAGAAGVLAVGVSAVRPVTIPLLALPLLYVSVRANFGATDVSVSDVALALGAASAVAFTRNRLSATMRNLLWLVAIYQVATLFTVVANPYAANTIEWVHAGLLVAGALFLGWTVGREGQGPLGLRLMLLAALVIATWTIIVGVGQVLRGDLQPVYLPHGMHKNFIGTVLGTSALIAYVRPEWLGLRPAAATAVFWWSVLGIGFAQSRQAIVALGLTLIVLVLRSRTDRRRSRIILLAIVPALVVVLTLVRDQIASGNVHNSFFARLTWFEEALTIWQTQPLTGVGLRWWYTGRFPGGIQPPNAELEVLTASGVLGLIGFLVLMVGCIVLLWRVEPRYGMLAVLVVLARFVQGQLDIFWVAAQTSIPFAIAGICLGVAAREDATQRTDAALADTVGQVAEPDLIESARA